MIKNILYFTGLAVIAMVPQLIVAASMTADPKELLAFASMHPDRSVAQRLVTTIYNALPDGKDGKDNRAVKSSVKAVGGLAPDGGDSQAVMQLAGELAGKINAARGDKAALARIVQEDLFGEEGVGRKVFIAVLPGGGNLANSIMTAS